jgi:hypothetical protein
MPAQHPGPTMKTPRIQRWKSEADMASTQAGTEPGRASKAWTGWVLFAALMIVLSGVFNAVEGLVALLNDEYFVVRENALLLLDFTAWGWITLLFGVFMIVVGLALNGARTWARIIAIGLAALNAIAQLTFASAHPLWSVLMIALDIVVIFALTARWDVAVAGMDSTAEYAAAPRYTEMRPPPTMPPG